MLLTEPLIWKYTTNGYVVSSPAVANGIVYVGSYDHNIYALNATTGILSGIIPQAVSVASSPAIANGIVYVGSGDNKVYALDASNGKVIWNYTTGGEVASSPAIANGIVYVGLV